MSKEYIERIKELFCDVHEDIMENLRDTDKEYSELLRSNVEESVKIFEIFKSLSNEEREFILKNKDSAGRLEWKKASFGNI